MVFGPTLAAADRPRRVLGFNTPLDRRSAFVPSGPKRTNGWSKFGVCNEESTDPPYPSTATTDVDAASYHEMLAAQSMSALSHF